MSFMFDGEINMCLSSKPGCVIYIEEVIMRQNPLNS